MRREGKFGRRKVFSEVKNVNVESLKNGSKLLDFLGEFTGILESERDKDAVWRHEAPTASFWKNNPVVLGLNVPAHKENGGQYIKKAQFFMQTADF